MLTILEAINRSTEYLENKGIESSRINAELLLTHVLTCKRLDLYLFFDRPLTLEETDLYREYLKRRVKFEPLQYILGEVEFYGLKFKVNPSVLIPRPETELLVETILAGFDNKQKFRILDIGTGSGNIVISLAKYFNNSKFIAIDISEDSLKLASENAKLNFVTGIIDFRKNDILTEQFNSIDKFDIIVSNPPYISINEYQNLQPELRVYEPKIALTDNADGFKFYHSIISKADSMLKKGGKLYLEMGDGQTDTVYNLFLKYNFNKVETVKDYQNIERIIVGELL